MRDMNFYRSTVGDFVEETKSFPIEYCDNYVAFHPEDWAKEMKPKLKEAYRHLKDRENK